jgi:hypothetical protein
MKKIVLQFILSVLADGTKLPPMVLLKGVRPPKNVPSGILIEMTPKSWANEEVMERWLSRVWRKNNEGRHLLVWDSFSAHITPKIKQQVGVNFNSDMAVIPGGGTSKLKPLDVSLNRPFKNNFRELYDEWIIQGPVDLTKGSNRRPQSNEIIMKWVKQSWDTISQEMVRKSFLKCGILLEMDGSQYHLIYESDDEDSLKTSHRMK